MKSIGIGNPPITQAWRGIWYVPIGTEKDPSELEIVRRLSLKPWLFVPASTSVDPFVYAEEIMKGYGSDRDDACVYLFIPGQAFDESGNRKGRGGGWYDRFLSRLPQDWLKIGVVPSNTKTDAPLEHQSWDIPMDWLVLE